MTVVVTGGSGFIGSAVIAELARRGREGVVFDRSVGDDLAYPEHSPLFEDADAVIHLAGLLGTAELFDRPLDAIAVNVAGTVNTLEMCRTRGLRYVGITMPPVWDSVYRVTKQAAEGFATAWHHHHGVPVAHVRAFNAYGPGQKWGEGHPQKLIPTFAALAWARRPLPVWGDGAQTVDLVHVDDVARMLVDALAFGDDEIFEAGTGTAVTVNEVAGFVNRVAGNSTGIKHLPMRKGEHPIGRLAATDEVGWARLGWRPGFSWDRVADAVRSYRP